jgi:beta-1,4-galactosyltransferase 2
MYENIIIIPYRHREAHLDYFIKHTVPLFQKYLPNTKVVVVEQNDGKLFNRGAVLNVGFKEYQNKTKYFFTNDVDINPTENVIKTIYTIKDIEILRIISGNNESLGGIIKVIHDKIFDANGFPNNIWGWGIEDRALYYRCCMKNIKIMENSNKSFNIMSHKSNVVEYTGEKKIISDIWRERNINKLNNEQKEKLVMSSGINNIEYTILERKMIHDIVELIKVDI